MSIGAPWGVLIWNARRTRSRLCLFFAVVVQSVLFIFVLLRYQGLTRIEREAPTIGKAPTTIMKSANVFDNAGIKDAAPHVMQGEDLLPNVLPVVMYVHKRPSYFESTLTALVRAGSGGLKPLIIVSHDGMHEGMDAVVQRAVATLPASHPGIVQLVHPGSLTRDQGRSSFDLGEGPASVLAVKRHWWWLMNRVWGSLLPKHYNGSVLFLEEDHVLSTDALLAMEAMVNSGRCIPHGDCFGYCLGSRSPVYKLFVDSSTMSASEGKEHQKELLGLEPRLELRRTFGFFNTGYALAGRWVWERLAAQEEYFWSGGYGWDWSVWRIMQRPYSNRSAGAITGLPTTMIYPVLSRAHNIGVEDGATVSAGNAFLIQGIPWAGGNKPEDGGGEHNWTAATMPADSADMFQFATDNNEPDGLDPRTITLFEGTDHYDCLRFERGAFGASRSQLDCPRRRDMKTDCSSDKSCEF
jgi:hypothetical protein